MPLTLVFSFVALFIMITPVLAGDDEASEQEITVNASSVRGFENLVCQLLHYYCTNTPPNVQQLLTKVDNLPKIAELLLFQDWYTKGNTINVRRSANLQRASRTFSPCICGLSSFKCCRRKRTLAKIEEAGNISAAKN